MLQWTNSLWLLMIPVIPLIRLLHQLRTTQNTLFVSSLLFWQLNNNENQITKPVINSPNKIWYLRAAIAGSLILSAASPHWITMTESKVHIWLDDSISMQTQEQNGSRASIAINNLLKKANELTITELSIHSLTAANKPSLNLYRNNYDNWKSLLNDWYAVNSKELQLPPQIQSTKGSHWLITDNADNKINQWSTKNPISQLLTIGSQTENSAISSFSVRPEITKKDSLSAIAQIFHDGKQATSRTLQLFSGNQKIKQWELNLSPQESTQIKFKIDLNLIPSKQLLLRFKHSDSLAIDDSLKLNSSFYLKSKIVGQCPALLIKALNTHPYLKIIKESTEESSLTIQCGNSVLKQKTAILKFHTAKQSYPNTKPLAWLTDSKTLNNLHFKQALLRYFPSPSSTINNNPIFVAGNTVLISHTKQPQSIVDCYLDLQHPILTNRQEFPVLIAGLIDLAVQHSYLDPIKVVNRPASESRIRALPISTNKPNFQPTYASSSYPLTPWLILLTIILVLTDWVIIFKHNTARYKIN